MTQTNFSAKGPSLGYYHQIRYSLLLLLKKPEVEQPYISIESLDDIVIGSINEQELFQTKLHITPTINLTEYSTDFWKTIRVWSEGITTGQISLEDSVFTLVTTESISTESILESLRPGEKRYLEKIEAELMEVAEKSKNKSNEGAYEAFKKLTKEQRLKLLGTINILDADIDITEVEENIKHELRVSTTIEKRQALYDRLEGWWFRQCIDQLAGRRQEILLNEVLKQVYQIVDEFKSDNLPIDFPMPFNLDDRELALVANKNYIKQLLLVSIKKNNLRNAVSDYRRAFRQKSKWIAENLLSPQEYIDYNSKLTDFWKRRFDQMLDDIEEDEYDHEEKARLGKSFYVNNYVLASPEVRIRERFREPYLAVGGSHILADELKIGWHPDFVERLKEDEE